MTPTPAAWFRQLRRFWRDTRPAPRLIAISAGLRALQVPITIASPFLAQYLFDHTLVRGGTAELLAVGGGLLLMALTAAACSQGHHEVSIRLRSRARARFGRALLDHVVRLPLPFFHDRDSGYLTSRLRGDLRTTDRLMPDAVLAALFDAVRALCFFVVLISLDAVLAGAALGLVFLLTFLVSRLTQPLNRHFHAALEVSARASANLQQLIGGLAVLRTMNAAPRMARHCTVAQNAAIRADAGRDRLQGLTTNAVSACAQVGIALILLVGAFRMIHGAATVGTLLASFVALSQLVSAGESVLSFFPGFLDGLAALKRLYAIVDEPRESSAPAGFKPPTAARGLVELDEVGFAYQPDAPVLHGLNLRIQPGEVVAMVGRSGAGKSTVAHLLARLYEPIDGSIRLDGQPLDGYDLSWLRQQVGLVSQQVFLINGTVRDNLLLGHPGATEAAMKQAARQAAAHDFIEQLPAGYDTEVGEDGARLSGGQRQRLALARELLRPSRVLILDEATSSLDARTEAQVRQAISDLLRARTCLVIAHRASTLDLADRVVMLDDGRIVADGTHEILLRESTAYKRLFGGRASGSGIGDLDRLEVEVEPPAGNPVQRVEPGAVVALATAGTSR